MEPSISVTRLLPFLLGLAAALLFAAAPADAVYTITTADVILTQNNAVGSGNGTLDYILFTESAGGAENSAGGFDGDDANTDMPTGVNKDSATESFVTSIGELRDFFILNFPDGSGGSTVNQMVIFIDLNQTTGGPVIQLNTLDILINYTPSFGDDRDDPWNHDVPSSQQNATGTSYSGGTLLATLDSPKALPLNEQGAGFADYLVLTHINPFDDAFSDETRILFHWASTGHDDGGETVFLSGTYDDTLVPEPGMMGLVLISGALVLARLRRR